MDGLFHWKNILFLLYVVLKYDSKCVELSKFIYSWLGAVSLGIGSLDLYFVFMDEILSIQFTGLLSMAANNNSNSKTISLFRQTPD